MSDPRAPNGPPNAPPDLPPVRPLILPPITDPQVHAQIDRLARRYREAAGPLMRIVARVSRGAGAARLPQTMSGQLDRAARAALGRAWRAASLSRGVMRNRGDRFNRLTATMAGAAGGAGGIAGALAELPVMVTLLMRAMLDIADEHGLDPDSDEVRLECLQIFAAAGPQSGPHSGSQSGPDSPAPGLSSLGIPLAGQTAQGLIAQAAPRLAAALGPKLAAQSAPVIGALTGATMNHAFVSYYQALARVHFGLIRLSHETGLPAEALTEALHQRLRRP